MARQAQAQVENNFVRGLITETTALTFPENACTELDNCTITDTGKITRRLPFDMEDSATPIQLSAADGAIISYRWESVAGTGTINFLVVQRANTLLIYDVSDLSTPVSNSKLDFEINLADHKTSNTIHEPSDFPCQFAAGDGNLVVVNRACEPFFVVYNKDTEDFSVESITLKIRDFRGMEDGLAIHDRPAGTLADLRTNNPEHWYNLFNQGWMQTDFLTRWDGARSDIPSNADYYWLYRGPGDPNASPAVLEGSFDNDMVSIYNPGNRPAPKGHAILDAFEPDRNGAMSDENVTTVTFRAAYPAALDLSGSTTITDFSSNSTRAFNGIWSESNANSAHSASSIKNCYIGKTLAAGAKIYGVNFNGPNNTAFVTAYSTRPGVMFKLYGKVGTAPANGTDGTELGFWTLQPSSYTALTPHNAIRTITNTVDTDTVYDHVWLYIDSTHSCTINIAEIEFQTFGDSAPQSEATYERPQCVESFSGRVFYSGVEAPGFNNNIYFTQIIEDTDQYGLCYQKSDPTSEDISDLLADDGGVIRIPEMGQVVKLFRLNNSLMVFATNGIWTVAGSFDTGSFKANEYQVQKVSNISVRSLFSFVDVRGTPIWWAEDGIYTVQSDQFGSVTVLNLTDKTIRSFILDIPTLNRRFVKGAYDAAESRVIWLFNDDASLQSTDYYKYNRVLSYNALTQAFYPYTVDVSGSVSIRDIQTVGYSELEGTIRYLISYNDVVNSEDQEYLLFAVQRGTSYKDWTDVATLLADNAEEKDYSSYFITGYKIHANLINTFQTNYVWVFLETEDTSSCFVQALWGFTNSSNSGRWSTPQQCYNSSLLHRDVNYRRMKLRGGGKALQLKVYSETGKPFTIIGFALFETANAAP